MKKILVPTDFSTISDNALEHAIEIASALKSELTLYHAYQLTKADYRLDLPDDQQPWTQRMKQRMEVKKVMFMDALKTKEVKMQTIVERETIVNMFDEVVERNEVDLIIMGSRGASGLVTTLFGSVAITAIETAKIPFIIVPPLHQFNGIKHIVMAIDRAEIRADFLDIIHQLGLAFQAKISLLSVYSNDEQSKQNIESISFDGVEVEYHKLPLQNSINDTINQFLDQEDCDLLCMIRRQKDFFQSIFQRSVTKTQVHKSQIPFLVIPEN